VFTNQPGFPGAVKEQDDKAPGRHEPAEKDFIE